MSPAQVYDIILVLILLFVVFRGWHQGALSEILRLAGWGAALVLVAVYSEPWSERLYHAVVEERAVAAVAAAIPPDVVSAMENGAAAIQSLQSVLNSLGGLLGGQIIDAEAADSILNLLQQDAMSLSQAVTQTVLQPVLLSVVQAVMSLLMLLVCLGISRGLARLVAAGRGEYNFLTFTNRFLGAVLGVGEGLVTGYVYVFVLGLLATFLDSQWLSQPILQQTYIVKLLL